jgi:hypothetical protein
MIRKQRNLLDAKIYKKCSSKIFRRDKSVVGNLELGQALGPHLAIVGNFVGMLIWPQLIISVQMI